MTDSKPENNGNQIQENSNNSLERRQARQKRIKTLMQWLGYPTGGLGIPSTIALFKAGEPILAIVTAFASLGLIVLAIAAKFASDVFNRILDKVEAKNNAEDLIKRIKNNPNLASLALNPLLLTMIATVHCYRGALPGRRVELYKEICDVLLGRRDEAKGISINLTSEQQKAVLQVLAFRLMVEKQTREFDLQLGCDLIENEFKNVAGNELTPRDFLKNIEQRSGLLVEREKNLSEFAHKSFQEYLTALEIKESNQELILTENINNSWWEETIRLYAAQTDSLPVRGAKCSTDILPVYYEIKLCQPHLI